jgi:hypothetical protein
MSGLYSLTVYQTIDLRTYFLDRKLGWGREFSGPTKGVRKMVVFWTLTRVSKDGITRDNPNPLVR